MDGSSHPKDASQSETTLDYQRDIPEILKAMVGLNTVIAGTGLERSLHHLVQLRASQINCCGFCVEMHTREARQDGEIGERLDRVVVWDQVDDFSEREKAAFAWTEALTDLDPKADLAPLRARLRKVFTDPEIGVLTAAVAMINLWNRVNISRH